ncbi:MAG: endonuclease/exonuclease/phosphatase family protein [Spirochaetaceae bacterium]
MRVATYNIHGCVGTDGCYDVTRIVRVVEGINPDIIGLQEVRRNTSSGHDIVEQLARAFPAHSILFSKTLEDRRGAYGNALVSRFPIIDYRDLNLEISRSLFPKHRVSENRRAVIARVSQPDDSECTVVVTHLGLERWARKIQAERLITAIKDAVDLRTETAIFLGDFNEWFFADRFLRHVDRQFSKHVVRRTFPSRFPILPLDRIWITARLRRTATWVYRGWPARVASDHLPLCVDVEEVPH